MLYNIISDENLRLKSEDSLLEFIISIFGEEDNEFPNIFSFLEKVHISNLSETYFIRFMERIEAGNMSGILWQNIRNRVCHSIPVQYINSQRYSMIRALFDGNNSSSFCGIIHNLTEDCGGNVDDRNVVAVTCSSLYHNGYKAKHAFDLDQENYFLSKNQSGSWIKYDFKEKKIIPTHYSIRSGNSGYYNNEPRDWVIEGSNDDSSWVELDTRNGITYLRGINVSLTFEIQQSQISDQGYRYIRLKETGKNYCNTYEMDFSALEFFGTLLL